MLVIGIGNEMRADDGAGIYAARNIAAQNLSYLTVLEHSGEGISLMEAWKDFDAAIVIDAAYSGSAPGTVHRYDAHRKQLPSNVFRFSTHAFGLAEAIELSRALKELPEKLIVFGIEAKTFEAGQAISEEVCDAIDRVSQQICNGRL